MIRKEATEKDIPITVPKKPLNRRDFRNGLHEMKRILPLFDKIEQSFLSGIDSEDYNANYTIHLEQWVKLTYRLIKANKFKYTVPKLGYFIDLYKPRE